MNEEIQALDAKGDILRERHAAVIAELKVHRAVRDAAVQRHLDTLTDEQLLTDETARRWLLKESFAHPGAHQRTRQVAAVGADGVTVEGYDTREEYEADVLPGLRLALKQHQPVEALADAIRSWAGTWALGREDIPVDILDVNCGERGLYGGRYYIADDRLEVGVSHYGHISNIADGPLVDGLKYVSDNLAYERADGHDDEDDYED